MKTRYFLPVLLMLAAWPAAAQSVRLHALADSVAIGERFRFALVIEHDGLEPVRFPDNYVPDSLRQEGRIPLGEIDLIQRLDSLSETYNDGTRIDSVIYEAAAFAVDTAYVPPVPLLVGPDDAVRPVLSAALHLPLRSTVPPDAEDIRDLAPLAMFGAPIWQWLLLAAVLLLVAGMIWYGRRQQAAAPALAPAMPPRPVLPPYEEALARLGQLQPGRLEDPALVKPFFVELADTVRTYLSRRLGVAALEHTTRELVGELKQMPTERIPEDVPSRVHNVLALADLAKFADYVPPVPESTRSVEQAKSLIEHVEASWQPPEPPEMGGDGEATEADALTVAPTPEVAVAQKRGWRHWLVVGIAIVAGLTLGAYMGALILWPTLFFLGAIFAARNVFSPNQNLLAGFAATVAQYGWLLMGYLMLPDAIAIPALASAEMIVAVLGLGWLVFRPSRGPLLLLTILHALNLASLFVTITALGPESAQMSAVLLPLILRLGAVVALLLGWRQLANESSD